MHLNSKFKGSFSSATRLHRRSNIFIHNSITRLETTEEDPFVVAAYAVKYVKGLQGETHASDGELMLSACCKHFTGYDLEKWGLH
ncbi:hypothetical protein Syun_023000 [Stephania yunnanensis]|uniref:Glycoside hydrolase family 3 N-terminal domain-containing protein n=1 Tax=Stephania yunnanensis TaxID=152371 RepID=A0AAP0FMG9_9MAGN